MMLDDDDVSHLAWRADCLAARVIHHSADVPAPLLPEKWGFLSLDGQQPVVLACRVNKMVIPAWLNIRIVALPVIAAMVAYGGSKLWSIIASDLALADMAR